MIPFVPQLPPRASFAGARASGAPSAVSTRSSCSLLKNPRERLSGDQNGYRAPSEDGITRAFPAARDWT